MKRLIHIAIVLLALFVLLGVPAFNYRGEILAKMTGSVDAVSSASVEIPDQPSGEYGVFINKQLHQDTLEQWESFFKEEPVDVIFEDINCMVASGDASAIELAERYMARLPENQMKIKTESGIFVVSKLDAGKYDIIILSKEYGDAYGAFQTFDTNNTYLIEIG